MTERVGGKENFGKRGKFSGFDEERERSLPFKSCKTLLTFVYYYLKVINHSGRANENLS